MQIAIFRQVSIFRTLLTLQIYDPDHFLERPESAVGFAIFGSGHFKIFLKTYKNNSDHLALFVLEPGFLGVQLLPEP